MSIDPIVQAQRDLSAARQARNALQRQLGGLTVAIKAAEQRGRADSVTSAQSRRAALDVEFKAAGQRVEAAQARLDGLAAKDDEGADELARARTRLSGITIQLGAARRSLAAAKRQHNERKQAALQQQVDELVDRRGTLRIDISLLRFHGTRPIVEVAPTMPTAPAPTGGCPRCRAGVFRTSEGWECSCCGWAWYATPEPLFRTSGPCWPPSGGGQRTTIETRSMLTT